MKLLLFCFLSLFAVVLAGTTKHSRGCIYILGQLCVVTMSSMALACRARGCGLNTSGHVPMCTIRPHSADSQSTGKEECPEGTHAYATGCSRKLPEATCEEPNPVLEEGILCDYSSCYCDPPTVRDPVSKKCVKLEDCPKKEDKKD